MTERAAGPTGPGTVVLDLGADVGALILYTPAELDGGAVHDLARRAPCRRHRRDHRRSGHQLPLAGVGRGQRSGSGLGGGSSAPGTGGANQSAAVTRCVPAPVSCVPVRRRGPRSDSHNLSSPTLGTLGPHVIAWAEVMPSCRAENRSATASARSEAWTGPASASARTSAASWLAVSWSCSGRMSGSSGR